LLALDDDDGILILDRVATMMNQREREGVNEYEMRRDERIQRRGETVEVDG